MEVADGGDDDVVAVDDVDRNDDNDKNISPMNRLST
jgi:hypothetical protein